MGSPRDSWSSAPRWVWIGVGLSALLGLLRLWSRDVELVALLPWLVIVGVALFGLIALRLGFPHLTENQRRNSIVYVGFGVVLIVSILIFGILNMDR